VETSNEISVSLMYDAVTDNVRLWKHRRIYCAFIGQRRWRDIHAVPAADWHNLVCALELYFVRSVWYIIPGLWLAFCDILYILPFILRPTLLLFMPSVANVPEGLKYEIILLLIYLLIYIISCLLAYLPTYLLKYLHTYLVCVASDAVSAQLSMQHFIAGHNDDCIFQTRPRVTNIFRLSGSFMTFPVCVCSSHRPIGLLVF